MNLKKMTLAVGLAVLPSTVLAQGVCDTGNCEDDSAGQPCVGSVPVGIVVSTAIRDAMQEAFLGQKLPACVGKDSLLCMPGISSAEFNRLISGTSTSWVPAGLPGITDNLQRCGISSSLHSGQAGINKAGFVTSETTETTIAQVTACMPRQLSTFPLFPSTSKIGLLPVTELATDDYKFIKLDGVAPLLSEHMSANYNLIANHASGAATYSTTSHFWGLAGGASLASGVACKMNSTGTSIPTLPPVSPVDPLNFDTPL